MSNRIIKIPLPLLFIVVFICAIVLSNSFIKQTTFCEGDFNKLLNDLHMSPKMYKTFYYEKDSQHGSFQGRYFSVWNIGAAVGVTDTFSSTAIGIHIGISQASNGTTIRVVCNTSIGLAIRAVVSVSSIEASSEAICIATNGCARLNSRVSATWRPHHCTMN